MRKTLKVVAFGGGPADAFIKAAGITDSTQQTAIKTLVNDLNGYGLWSKMKAIYPMVGGNATAHSYNLKDTTKFQITWSGGITHSSNGVLPNGTNGYGDTKLTPSTSLTDSSGHLSIYSRTNVAQNSYDIGATTGGTADNMVASRYGINVFYANYGALTYPSYANTDSRGHFITNRNSITNTTGFINGIRVINTSQTGAVASKSLYVGCLNNDGAVTNYSSRQLSFATIGDGLSDTEAANLYTSIQKFQTTLNRFVGTPIYPSFDSDAQSFMTSASITDSTQQAAVNYLVTDLKSNNLWTKMKAVYPMVGGTANSHKFNLKDPRDLDAAYRLVFNGGWTHSSTGALPNGSNAYADTKLNDSLLTPNSSHLSYYSRINANLPGYDIGLYSATLGKGIWLTLRDNANRFAGGVFQSGSSGEVAVTNLDSKGFYIGCKNGSTLTTFYKNGSSVVSATKTDTTASNYNLFLASLNNDGVPGYGYSNKECSFSTIGEGLSDTEASNLYTIIQNYQTILNRQV